MNIVPASPEAFNKAIELLESNNLPTEDISQGTQLFVVEENQQVVGTVAIEYDYQNALLRSLSVSNNRRNKKLGTELVNFIEDYVQRQGVEFIYLLTTTAANFFLKQGYIIIDRTEVPPFIQRTSEYCSVCPASATVMKKSLSIHTKP